MVEAPLAVISSLETSVTVVAEVAALPSAVTTTSPKVKTCPSTVSWATAQVVTITLAANAPRILFIHRRLLCIMLISSSSLGFHQAWVRNMDAGKNRCICIVCSTGRTAITLQGVSFGGR